MAVTKTWLVDGSKTAILHVFFESNGVDGELDNYVLVDPTSDFSKPMGATSGLTINQIWHSFAWFDAKLSFDAISDAPAWALARDAVGYTDFRFFGGIKDRAWPDPNGRLLITTYGYAPQNSTGSMIIEFRKD